MREDKDMVKVKEFSSEPSAPPPEEDRVIPEGVVILSGEREVGSFKRNNATKQSYQSQQQEEEEAEEDIVCRCCHDSENRSDMIVPCNCTGSVRYVHRSCLDKWRTIAPNAESFYRCDICHTNYVFEVSKVSSNLTFWKYLKFTTLVAADLFLVLSIWQGIVLMMSLAAFLLSFSRFQFGHFTPLPPIFNYYIVGNLSFFFILGLLGIFIGLCAACNYCFGCFGEREATPYTYSTYPYYYSSWDLSFFMFWYFSPLNMYYYSSGNACGPDCCTGLNFNSGDCNLNCDGGGSGDGIGGILIGILLVIVAIIIILGIFIAVFLLVTIGFMIITRRLSLLKRKSDLTQYVVMDLRDQKV